MRTLRRKFHDGFNMDYLLKYICGIKWIDYITTGGRI
jgi:hypothetical protein